MDPPERALQSTPEEYIRVQNFRASLFRILPGLWVKVHPGIPASPQSFDRSLGRSALEPAWLLTGQVRSNVSKPLGRFQTVSQSPGRIKKMEPSILDSNTQLQPRALRTSQKMEPSILDSTTPMV